MGLIRKRIGEAATYEGLAEECVEMAHAAMKIARLLRGDNPGVESRVVLETNLKEEFSDVMNYVEELGLKPDEEIMAVKQKRFIDRWDAKEAEKYGR